MLDNNCQKKKRKNSWAPLRHENTFAVKGFSFPNALRVMAVKKETELSDLMQGFATLETLFQNS